MTTLILASLFLAFIAVFVSKFIARKLVFRGRVPVAIEEIYNSAVKKYDVRYETFQKIYKALGDCYKVDPRFIQPSDPMKKFFDIDTWELGEGTNRLEDWLGKTFEIERKKVDIGTVLDLLLLAEQHNKKGTMTPEAD